MTIRQRGHYTPPEVCRRGRFTRTTPLDIVPSVNPSQLTGSPDRCPPILRHDNKMAPHSVDVIVPVYNQFGVVKRCIDSVIESAPFNRFDIIVVDDASSDLDLRNYLNATAKAGAITLFRNTSNIGFTGTVNFGMLLHPDRDVLLLNSDTAVHGSWLERLRAAAYSDPKVATVNPLTNASHISGYPFRDSNDGVVLEVNDDVLDDLAAENNAGKYVNVHTTVGFCMFIKRECINSIGLFDVRKFPVGYGEESDFCYRAKKVGWQHLIVGDVFVRHFENQSFGERKNMLMQEMIPKFVALHPEIVYYDDKFKKLDPLRSLRAGLDLARVKRLLAPRTVLEMHVVQNLDEAPVTKEPIVLLDCLQDNLVKLCVQNHNIFPNLERYRLPRDMLRFNAAMRYLGIEKLLCRSASELSIIDSQVVAMPMEAGLEPKLEVATVALS